MIINITPAPEELVNKKQTSEFRKGASSFLTTILAALKDAQKSKENPVVKPSNSDTQSNIDHDQLTLKLYYKAVAEDGTLLLTEKDAKAYKILTRKEAMFGGIIGDENWEKHFNSKIININNPEEKKEIPRVR